MGYIQFTDEVGSVTLQSSYPAGPARRLRNWTPNVTTVGPRVFALGTGRPYEFAFRRDYTASFDISGLLPSQHEDFMRFKVWALKGCIFELYTDDADNHFYECRIAPETEPALRMEDAVTLEYSMNVTVRNVAGTPMICNYRG